MNYLEFFFGKVVDVVSMLLLVKEAFFKKIVYCHTQRHRRNCRTFAVVISLSILGQAVRSETTFATFVPLGARGGGS